MNVFKKIFVLSLLVLLSGCASASLQKLSQDTFSIYKEDHRGMFGSKSSFIDDVKSEAQAVAKSNGGRAVGISSFYTPPGPAQWATFKYEFRVVNQNINFDQTTIDNISSRCLINAVADYDDGISDANSIAKAVVNKCKNECIYDPMNAYNLSIKSKDNLRASCLEKATDTIFQVRHIKRDEGEVKRFGKLLYVKRRGDSHYQILLSLFDVTNKIEFNVNCQRGTDSNSVDMHNIELIGNELFDTLGLESEESDVVKLYVNSKPVYFLISDKEGAGLVVPSANLEDFFSSTEKIFIKNNKNIIEFSTGGYRDAIKIIETECSTVSSKI